MQIYVLNHNCTKRFTFSTCLYTWSRHQQELGTSYQGMVQQRPDEVASTAPPAKTTHMRHVARKVESLQPFDKRGRAPLLLQLLDPSSATIGHIVVSRVSFLTILWCSPCKL